MTRKKACSILKKYAVEHGLAALADKIGCSKPFASLVTRGKRGVGWANAITIEAEFAIPQDLWRKTAQSRKRGRAA